MKHSISAAARIAGLSLDVIRSWERRYKLVEPTRDASGVRLYSDEEVARLALAREATRLGHPIRRVAHLSDEELEKLVERKSSQGAGNSDVVARLMRAMHANQPAAVSQILRSAALLTPAHEFVLEILAPALREIGREWENRELAIWQEHFLSNQMLAVTATLEPAVPGEARILLATPPFERHGFGIALAAVLAGAHGVAACNLGVAVPADELIAAARRLNVTAVVVGMTQESVPEKEALHYARALNRGLPRGVELVLGGKTGTWIAHLLRRGRIRSVATLEEFDVLCRRWR